MYRPTLLLADDHVIVADGLRSLLKDEFELVGSVTNGLALVEAAERFRPDIIVSDLYLPSATDECFVRQVRANAFSAHLPVVVITGWTTEPHRDLALELSTDSFLPLPIRPRELVQVIARLFARPIAPLSPLGLSSERHDPTVANGL